MGKSGSVEQIPAIKWSLNVLIASSAALRSCISEGASCKLMSLALSFFGRLERIYFPASCMMA